MHKKYFRKFGALAVCLLLGLSVTDVGFSEWETSIGSTGGSVTADIETDARVVITSALIMLDGNACLSSEHESDADESEDEIDAYEAESEKSGTVTESSDAEYSLTDTDTDAESDKVIPDDAVDTEEALIDTDTDSESDETLSDDYSDTGDTEAGFDETADGENESDAGEAGMDDEAPEDTDSDETSDSETSPGAEVVAVEQHLTGAALDVESDTDETADADVSTIALDADDIVGLKTEFPGVYLPDAASSVTYSITVENKGQNDVIASGVTLPEGLECFAVDCPDLEEGQVLEPGGSLELVWTVILSDTDGAEIVFSVETDFELPDAGKAPEAFYLVKKAGEGEEE